MLEKLTLGTQDIDVLNKFEWRISIRYAIKERSRQTVSILTVVSNIFCINLGRRFS